MRKLSPTETIHRGLIERHIALGEETQRLVTYAQADLWHGPIALSGDNGPDDGEPWPGFTAACNAISEALDDHMDLWIDTTSDSVWSEEPGWERPCDSCCEETAEDCDQCNGDRYINVGYDPSDFWHYEERDWKRLLFGELASYL